MSKGIQMKDLSIEELIYQYGCSKFESALDFPNRATVDRIPALKAELLSCYSQAQEKVKVLTCELEAYKDPLYCPECGACGIDGCCIPDKCQHIKENLKCLYGEDYAKSYHELLQENADLTTQVSSLKVRISNLNTSLELQADRVDKLIKENIDLEAQAEQGKKLLDLVEEKFRSGNDIPVERITITRKEYDLTKQHTL